MIAHCNGTIRTNTYSLLLSGINRGIAASHVMDLPIAVLLDRVHPAARYSERKRGRYMFVPLGRSDEIVTRENASWGISARRP